MRRRDAENGICTVEALWVVCRVEDASVALAEVGDLLESRGLLVSESLRLEIGLAKVNRGRHVKLRQGKVFLLNEIKREYRRYHVKCRGPVWICSSRRHRVQRSQTKAAVDQQGMANKVVAGQLK